MISIVGSQITSVKGDTIFVKLNLKNKLGTEYDLNSGDILRFVMKKNISDSEPLLIVDIPVDTRTLIIPAAQTKQLTTGNYIYDIELTTIEGFVSTLVNRAQLTIVDEVD